MDAAHAHSVANGLIAALVLVSLYLLGLVLFRLLRKNILLLMTMAAWSGRLIVAQVKHRHLLRWYKRHGYADDRDLLARGSAADIATFVRLLTPVDDPNPFVVRGTLSRLRQSNRSTIAADVVLALMDRGLPPAKVLEMARWTMPGAPAVYERVINCMTPEALSAPLSGNTGAPAWYSLLVAAEGMVNRDSGRIEEGVRAMTDMVVMLRNKGLDVSEERLVADAGRAPVETYYALRNVVRTLSQDVEMELLRRERANLAEVADQAMAEAPAPAQPRARARL